MFPRSSSKRKLALLSAFALLVNCISPALFPYGSKASAEPQAAQADFVRQVSLPTKDIVYDKNTKKFYASVPSTGGSRGNTITPIDPATGALGASVFVGSDPGKLALSANGQYLYTFLEGAYAIRRMDVASQTPGLQYSTNLYTPFDMAVVPGKPETLALSASGYLMVYDNEVRRPNLQALSSYPYIEFGATGDPLYAITDYSPVRLQKYSLTASGVTLTSNMPITGSSGDFHVDNGRVYLPSGQVVDADTGALLGTFPNVGYSPLVAPDSSVGRVYFLSSPTSFSSTWTIRAYDMNTFVLIGTMTVNGVVGAPTSFQRWGANGLAFRTGGPSTGVEGNDQVYLIQTSLIPSAEPVPAPIPTPTPTPTPQPTPTPAVSVRQLALPANDLVYDPNRETLYASVPSVAGQRGNSITAINPAAGTIGTSTFIGSEPTRMSMTDDGQFLYTYLEGAAAINRFDLTTQQPGLQFSLGSDQYYGLYQLVDMTTLPGVPNSIAVSRRSSSKNIAVYDNGVARPTASGSSYDYNIEPASSNSVVYTSSYSSIQKHTINASGVTQVQEVPFLNGGDIRFSNGLLYTTAGRVLDPETGAYKGTFNGVSNYSYTLVLPDPDNGRVFFLSPTSINGASAVLLRAYDINSYLPLGSLLIPGANGRPTSLVRWGTNGLAFRTNGNNSAYDSSLNTTINGQIFLIQTALVNPGQPVTNPSPTPTPVPAATPLPPVVDVTQMALPTNDLIYDSSRKTIMASVPGSAGANGNSIAPIDPVSASIGTPVFIGSEPNKLAISSDNQYLYAGLDGAGAVRRFDLATKTPGLQFSLGTNSSGQLKAWDLAVVPGLSTSIAVSRSNSSYSSSVALYDDGTQRPTAINLNSYQGGYIEFAADSNTLYETNGNTSPYYLEKLSLSNSGLTLSGKSPTGTYYSDFRIAGGRAYFTNGRVLDIATGNVLGRFGSFDTLIANGVSVLVAPDPANGRVYFLTGINYSSSTPYTVTLQAFDVNSFLPLGTIQIPGVMGLTTSFIRWGGNGLAFRTGPVMSGTTVIGGNQVYILRTSLVPSNEVIPATVKLDSAALSYNEATGNANITVTRMGDNSGATTVQYATSDGTATAGFDYTATSGTVNFAAGESTKTITVPIINDNYYEGNETFNLTLSNATGATIASPGAAVVTIVENDSKPSVSVQGFSSVVEPGKTGTVDAVYTVRLSNPSVQTVTMDYATADGTATAGNDYVAASGTLTFAPGETTKTITLQVKGDEVDEVTETFYLDLKNSVNTQSLINYHIPINIQNSQPAAVRFGTSSLTVSEGIGNVLINVQRVNDISGTVTVNYATGTGTAEAVKDYTATAGTLTFGPGETIKSFSVPIVDDPWQEGNETIPVLLSNPTGGATITAPGSLFITITDNDQPTIELSNSNYLVNENEANSPQGFGYLTVGVKRGGDTSAPATVKYSTSDQSGGNECNQVTGAASQRCDYTAVAGTLRFAAGESTKEIQIPIINDGYVENLEFFTLKLQSPTGASLGIVSQAAVNIVDDDSTATDGAHNPYLSNEFFVRMNYLDFLSRDPDINGFTDWTTVLNNCGTQKGFLGAPPECDRAHVSHGFFGSPEFTNTGFLIYRLYEVGMNRLPRYSEFTPDMASLSGFGLSDAVQQQNLSDYLQQFTSRTEFTTRFSDALLTSQAATLIQKLEQTAGVTLPATATTLPGQPTQYGRQELINLRANGTFTVGQVVKAFVEQQLVYDKYFPRAQVTMLYFAYLKRDPDLNDPNLLGWNEWVFVFTNGGAQRGRPDIAPRDIQHLIFGFIYSEEYRKRFGTP